MQTVDKRPPSSAPTPPPPPSITLPREEEVPYLPQKVADKEQQVVQWIQKNAVKKEKRSVREQVFDSESD